MQDREAHTLLHLLSIVAYGPLAQAAFAAWHPKAPKPLALALSFAVASYGSAQHLAPLVSAPYHGLLDGCRGMLTGAYALFLVTFVHTVCEELSPGVAAVAVAAATVSALARLFSPADAFELLLCGASPRCWRSPVRYAGGDVTADVVSHAFLALTDLTLAAVCVEGRRRLEAARGEAAREVKAR